MPPLINSSQIFRITSAFHFALAREIVMSVSVGNVTVCRQ